MVSGGTPLEKAYAVDALSECWQDRESFLSKDLKVLPNGQSKNTNLHEPLSEFAGQNGKLRRELHPDLTAACNMSRFPAGAKGTQDETSLFSSSLSDLLMHKSRFSASNASFHQSAASNAGSQNGRFGSLNCVEEINAQAIKNLLPDEEELLSGVASLGHVTHAGGNKDDFEDFDLFSSIGGIELEADEGIWAGNRSGNFNNKSIPNSQWGSVRVPVNPHNDEFMVQKTNRLINGGAVQKHNSCVVENTIYPSSAFRGSAGNQFSHSPNFVNFDSCYANSLHSHSLPDSHNHLGKVIPPWTSLDNINITDCTAESPRVTGEITRDLYQAGIAAKAAAANGRGYGYSANGSLPYQMDRYLSGKSDLYECHPSRSSVWSNSPSFQNGEHGNYAMQLPGFHKLPHPNPMMNVTSPIHFQVGSAPGVNGAFWDPLESFEDLSVKPNAMQSVGMHFGSPANSVELSSHHSFSHAAGSCMGAPNHADVISQMSHSLNGRNSSISMPSTFGFPNERVRNRANSSNADKKNYELNIDRIMRGDDARTTLMIKNIPNKYTSKMLLATIDEQHKGKYDFIYLPIDFKNKCNVGYAFINVVDPKHIVSFYQTFNGKRWEKFNSEKIATLAYARIQGKCALIAHFQNSSLMNEDKRCRPILFQTEGPNAGDQEPFPSSNSFRLRSGRAHAILNGGDMEGRGQGRCNGTKAA